MRGSRGRNRSGGTSRSQSRNNSFSGGGRGNGNYETNTRRNDPQSPSYTGNASNNGNDVGSRGGVSGPDRAREQVAKQESLRIAKEEQARVAREEKQQSISALFDPDTDFDFWGWAGDILVGEKTRRADIITDDNGFSSIELKQERSGIGDAASLGSQFVANPVTSLGLGLLGAAGDWLAGDADNYDLPLGSYDPSLGQTPDSISFTDSLSASLGGFDLPGFDPDNTVFTYPDKQGGYDNQLAQGQDPLLLPLDLDFTSIASTPVPEIPLEEEDDILGGFNIFRPGLNRAAA